MTHKRPLVVGRVAVAFVSAVLVHSAQLASAQPAPAQSSACRRPAHECPAPWSLPGVVSVNLTPDAQGECRFEPRLITDLEADLGGDVYWQFCSTCDADMTVQMDTSLDGPFDNFRIFTPLPTADNLVTLTVPCQDYGQASGRDAQEGGEWKYSLRTKPAGALAFTDEIDPKLEIDEYRIYRDWFMRLVMIALGALGGFMVARRRRTASGR